MAAAQLVVPQSADIRKLSELKGKAIALPPPECLAVYAAASIARCSIRSSRGRPDYADAAPSGRGYAAGNGVMTRLQLAALTAMAAALVIGTIVYGVLRLYA